MAGKSKKKDINDPEFFDDAHLDAVGEDVVALDPDLDDPTPVVEENDLPDEGDAPVATSEDTPVAEEDEAPVEEWVDPAPHLTELDAAKVAYAEVRKWANERDMTAQKLEERIAQLEVDLTEYDIDDPAPAYDPQAFTHIAGQDPRAAFEYALQNGQASDARAAIAQVQADSAELASAAAIANANNDPDGYAHYRQQAVNAAAQAQEMAGQFQQAEVARTQAPLIAADRNRNIVTAEAHLAQQTQGDYTQRRNQVIQVLRERPYLIQGHGVQDLARGFKDAYDIAKAMPAPVEAPAAIDDAVKAAVDKHLAAARSAKKAAAEAAGGAGSGRTGPPASSGGESEQAQIIAASRSASMGARAFMDG